MLHFCCNLIGGYILNEEELTALQQIYDDNLLEQLMNEGLKLAGNVTIEEVQYYLVALEMVDEANNLKEELATFIKSKQIRSQLISMLPCRIKYITGWSWCSDIYNSNQLGIGGS